MQDKLLLYKRYNTESDKKSLRKKLRQSVDQIVHDEEGYSVDQNHNSLLHSQNAHPFIHSAEDCFMQDSIQGNDMFGEQMNFSQQIKSRYMTCYNGNIDQVFPNQQCLSFKVRNLMIGLKELIKELSLTKNSNNQVEEELQKLIGQFQDTIQSRSTKQFERSSNKPKSLSSLSQIRVHTLYQIQDPPFNTLTDNDPFSHGLNLFHPFLSGTSFESEESQTETRLNSLQQQLLSEYLERYLFLLQKQINRILRYNGQKKLKYLLSTVMKQIFTQLMRFTYETKISVTKRSTNNLLNNITLKINILASTLQRMLNTNTLLNKAFTKIKHFINSQQKSDIKLINKFHSKINYLDNLMKMRNRTDLREKFLKWKRNAIVMKETERIVVVNGIINLGKEILYEFALNEENLQKWKFIVWGRLNQFVKSICYMGECVLFPVDEGLIQTNNDGFLSSSVVSERMPHQSIFSTNSPNCYNINNHSPSQSNDFSSPSSNSSHTYRYSQCSPNTNEQDATFISQKKLLDSVHEAFSLEEIKDCLQHGEIVMHDVNVHKLILIPLKSVAAIIVVKYQIYSSNHKVTLKNNQTQSSVDQKVPLMNVNSFYNILNAIQLSQPMILELMTLKEKFEYFSSRIEEKAHHKFILNHLLTPSSQRFNQTHNKNPLNLHDGLKKSYKQATISQFVSIQENESPRRSQRQCHTNLSYEQVDNLLTRMNVKRVLMYHKLSNDHQSCLNYTVNCQKISQNSNIFGKDIVQAIFTELQKINKNFLIKSSQSQPKCLYLRKSVLSFYACPIIEKSQLIGFVEIHLQKDLSYQTTIPNNNNNEENSFIVKTVDSKSEILNQTIVFVTQVIVPMIIKLRLHNEKEQITSEKSSNPCQICCQSAKFSQRMRSIDLQTGFESNSQTYNLQLSRINDLFIKITKEFNFPENKTYQIQKLFLHQIQKYHHSLQSVNQYDYSEEEIALIKQQYFTKVFYLTTPRTKDSKPFIARKQKQQKNNQYNFYHTTSSQSHLQKSINLPFIDMLKLFSHKGNNINEFEPQKIQISISKLNEIYRSMLRKMKSVKSASTQQNLTFQSSQQQNHLQTFIQELLKSTLLKSDVLCLEEDKKYHALELWLYQLEHINKKYGNDKLFFVVSVSPVFSFFCSKNKFLSAIVCSAGVIISNEALSQRSHNSRNQTVHTLNQFSFKLAQQLFSRVIELQFIQESSQKVYVKTVQPEISSQFNMQDLKKRLNLKKLNNIEVTKQRIYNKTQSEIHQIVANISQLQSFINHRIKFNAKSIIISKFYFNFKQQKYHLLNRFVSVIQRKIITKNLVTKSDIFSFFISKLFKQNLMRSRHYLINTVSLVQKMSNVFIRNKMLKTSFRMLKSFPFSVSSEVIEKLFEPGLKITKKFSLQRMETILRKKIYKTTSHDSVLSSSFKILKAFSNYRQEISSYKKRISIMNLTSTVQKLICTKSYLSYFKNLQHLEKSLYWSLSLIGTEIQTIDFYSVHQFLHFLNQRISIIINGEKRLIQILYGSFINKIIVGIVIQNLQNNKLTTLSLDHDHQNQELIFSQILKEIKSTQIFMTQKDMQKFYISLQFMSIQSEEESKNINETLKDLKRFIQNIFKDHVSFVFEKFIILYSKKMQTFVLKLSKFLKIPVHFSKKNREKQNEDYNLKKYALKKLKVYFYKQVKCKKIQVLQEEINVKSAQLSRLHDFYEKRAKKLMAPEQMQERSEINMNEFISEQSFEKIISKKCLKTLRKDIQNLDMSNENLSIQYQIKSKTVAGHQMMEIISTKERKQAMKEVFSNLSIIMNENSITNWYSANRFFLNGTGKQINWSTTSRRFPEQTVQEVIVEEKQRLNYSRVSHLQEKSLYDEKFKKASVKSISKVLKGICQGTFRKSFYRINSYSWMNSPKVIR